MYNYCYLLQLKLKRDEMEFQNEYENIERRFLSMIEHCGINKDDYPIPTPARGIVGTPPLGHSQE